MRGTESKSICVSVCVMYDETGTDAVHLIYSHRIGDMHLMHGHQCQKRPTLVSKETYTSVKRDLH
jgi:hypothetical protein